MGARRPQAERFAAKVAYGDGCWPWTASIDRFGFGKIGTGVGSATALAHRVSWELHFGPIPTGGSVRHHCDDLSCVRPDHLFLVTEGATSL